MKANLLAVAIYSAVFTTSAKAETGPPLNFFDGHYAMFLHISKEGGNASSDFVHIVSNGDGNLELLSCENQSGKLKRDVSTGDWKEFVGHLGDAKLTCIYEVNSGNYPELFCEYRGELSVGQNDGVVLFKNMEVYLPNTEFDCEQPPRYLDFEDNRTWLEKVTQGAFKALFGDVH